MQAVNFTKDQQNHGGKIRMWKCIKYIIKKKLSLLKDLLEP